jgi:hypothetical protein
MLILFFRHGVVDKDLYLYRKEIQFDFAGKIIQQ